PEWRKNPIGQRTDQKCRLRPYVISNRYKKRCAQGPERRRHLHHEPPLPEPMFQKECASLHCQSGDFAPVRLACFGIRSNQVMYYVRALSTCRAKWSAQERQKFL